MAGLPTCILDLLVAAGVEDSLTMVALFPDDANISDTFFNLFGDDISDDRVEEIEGNMDELINAIGPARREAERRTKSIG